jgi:hypothetical protein
VTDLVSKIIWFMGDMKSYEEGCHKPNDEFCNQCQERKRLRRKLADILIEATKMTEEDLKDVL